jgi:hypothetical protein
MSLVTSAAPFESKINTNYKKSNIQSTKVSNVLSKIHDNINDNESNLENFTPLPKPESVSVSKTKSKENFYNNNNQEQHDYSKVYKESFDNLNQYSNITFEQPNIDFINTIPQYKSYNNNTLEKKLNKIIELLEKQKDYKTNTVTEEIFLYSLFGIFTIYLIDSFKRVGKYTR